MDHFGILKRALKITWRQRALWVFGFLLALAGSGAGGGFRGYTFGGGRPGMRPQSGRFNLFGEPFRLPQPDWPFPSLARGEAIAVIGVLVLFILFIVVIFTIVRYLSENALIKMVDQAEETGSAGTAREGFRKGWSRPAWRMFLADLVVGIPVILFALFLVAIGLSPLLLTTVNAAGMRALGLVLTIPLMFLVIVALIVVSVVVNLVLNFAHRELALAGKGTIEAISSAYGLIRRHLSDVGMVWLLMAAAGIGWGLVMIPVAIIFLVLALIMGGGPALALHALQAPLWLALLVGIPLGLVAFVIPVTFVAGLFQTFKSTVWTLTYREVRVKEVVAPAGG